MRSMRPPLSTLTKPASFNEASIDQRFAHPTPPQPERLAASRSRFYRAAAATTTAKACPQGLSGWAVLEHFRQRPLAHVYVPKNDASSEQ